MQAAAVSRRPGEGRRIWIVGDEIEFKATGDDTGGQFALLEVLAKPGGGPPPHIHRNEDEFWYVLDGEFEILQGKHTVRATAGTYAYVPRGMVHRFENVGDAPARVLVGFSPAGFERFFFEAGVPAVEGGTPPPLGPEEIERSNVAAAKYGMELRWPEGAPA